LDTNDCAHGINEFTSSAEIFLVDIEDLDYERGHRTLKILRKGGKHAVMTLARGLRGAIPQRCAQAASERSRSGWSPAATNKMAAVRGPAP
jgi:hypothetical protein